MSKLQQLNDLIPREVKEYTPAVLIGIGSVWIVGKLCVKVVSRISERNMLARWSNTPKDTIIVHRFPPAYTAPNASPFPLKLETFLRMAKIPYQLDLIDCISVKGKSPWITLNGEHIADSQFCVEFIRKKFNVNIGNGKYSDDEKAVATLTRIAMEEHFYFGLLLWRYIYTKGRDFYTLFSGMNTFMMTVFLRMWVPVVKQTVWYQGIGRHSQQEVIEIMRNDLRAVSKVLGKKKYLLGDEPCEDDAAVFGMLAQVVWCFPDSPFEKLVNDELHNLREYCFRIKEVFWPDWDEYCAKRPDSNKKVN